VHSSSDQPLAEKKYKKQKMRKLRLYIEDTTNELMTKVSWPSWKELQDSAIIVMIASLIIALIVFVMDYVFNKGTGFLYDLFK